MDDDLSYLTYLLHNLIEKSDSNYYDYLLKNCNFAYISPNLWDDLKNQLIEWAKKADNPAQQQKIENLYKTFQKLTFSH